MASYDFEKLRVMIVDDDPFMVRVVKTLLEALGVRESFAVEDQASLLRELQFWQPDILIVDQMMKPLTGLEIIKGIRQQLDDRRRFLPIILLTGYSHQQVVLQARFQAGADAVLAKPISAQRLYDCFVSISESDRCFVRTGSYFGPDRRVTDRPFEGPNQRRMEPEAAAPSNAVDLVRTGKALAGKVVSR